ncbi:MAG: DNA-directed DNA polymerase I [Nitrososphaerota archaeon]|nr:DNA-directed DNA polymerase I [Nitrososphaerota archaeon]
MTAQSLATSASLAAKLAGLMRPAGEIGESLLASATYDGDTRKAVLKFYDPKAGRFWLWEDNTGHRPYCFTRLPMEELGAIRARKDVVAITEEDRLDLVNDTTARLRKIVTTDPLAIGGGNDSIRDQIRAWEADIKYYENYAYDLGLRMGTYYRASQGKVVAVRHEVTERVARSLEEILKKNPPEFTPYLKEWAELLGEPLVEFKRVALDIEVDNEPGRLPDVENPNREVIAVSFYSESEKQVYLLKGERSAEGLDGGPFGFQLFEREEDLLRAVLSKIMDYPVVVTFNGDDFDLRYLRHRAEKLGVGEDEDPIQLERVAASLKHGIHVDLYQFFRNRSIQVYAFGNRYTDHTLGGISESLIGKSKLEFEGEVGALPLLKLGEYCLNDSQLTFELTSTSDSLVMKLLLMISRIGKMPMNDVSRLGISNWIRSMLFFEHRRIGALIPRQDELSEKGGASSKSVIKGKKYKGGLVIDPKPGVYFDVSVLDFASLYPSLMKVHNLSYETVNCPHPECRANKIPDTDSWECIRKKGITSLVIGSLRDLRVGHYKQLAKDSTLSKQDRELYGVVSQSLKVYLNGAYGSFGFESFAFYCLPVAEATAALGRDAITRTISKCKELGVDVLYSDTDSLFLHSPSKEQVLTISHWADKDLGVELDLDKVYRYVAFSSRKKNYFGVLPDGTVDIKGLTGKKSVDGATPMLARFDERVQLVTVRDVFKAFRGGSAVEVLTVADGLNTAWAGISDATRHDVADVYRMETSKGRDLVLSGDHSVYIMDAFGHLHCRATRSLKRGDVVVGVQYVPPRNPSTTLPVLRYLVTPVRVKEGRAYSGKAHATSSTPIPIVLPMCEELATLLGIYVAEGNTSSAPGSRNNSITQSRRANPEVCSAIEASWRALFQVPAKVYRRDGGANSYYLPKLHAELLDRLCGGSSSTKHVPSVVHDADGEFVAAFLRGVFSGDGYGDGKRVNIASKSRTLLVGLGYLLARFDIDTRIRVMRVKGSAYHQLSILGPSSRGRFYAHIGFMQPRFNRGVKFGPRNKELLPLKTDGLLSLKGEIMRRKGLAKMRGISMHDSRYYNLSILDRYNSVLRSLMQVADTGEKARLAKIATMLNVKDVSFDEIVSVKKIPGRKAMFDFSIPTFERFVAGNLPTLLHNSQTPEYLKRVFYKTLDILSGVKTPEDFERARTDTKGLLTTMLNELKGKKVPVIDLAFTVMMGKPADKYSGTTPQHVRAALQLQERGKEVKAGEMIAYVKTKTPPYVKPAELARSDEIDPDKYIEYAHSMFDQLLDALDFSFDEIMGATTLDLFWGS